jgi:response regulator RpfG family c-di-GMP phosphodiesterase
MNPQKSISVAPAEPARLLVIDDDKNLLFGLKSMLRKAKYVVMAAESGGKALDLIHTTRPDLVLCDVMMPPPNGFELYRLLKSEPQMADIPFIFLSARASKEDVLTGLRAGADDYLIKPFDAEILLTKIATMLERRRKQVQLLAQAKFSQQAEVDFDQEYQGQMQVIRQISGQIYGDADANLTLGHVLAQMIGFLDARAVEVWWKNEINGQVEFRLKVSPQKSDEPGSPDGASLNYSNLNLIYSTMPHVDPGGIICEIPLQVGSQQNGFVRIFLSELTMFGAIHSPFIDTLVNYLSIIMDKEQITRQMETIVSQKDEYVNQLLSGLTSALDMRDHDTGDHTQRVMGKTLKLARKFGLSDVQLEDVRMGSIVHDIGKIAVPDDILSKPAPLSADEWKIMRMHPYYAIDLLSKFDFIDRGLDIPLYHHERWDGRGYPFGLSGSQIPFSAQLFSIVDVWDALTNDRIYHKAISPEAARAIILAESGKAFNPKIVTAFLELFAPDA